MHDRAEPRLLEVEVHSAFQIPGCQIVGLPSQEVSEARERIRAGMEAQGFEFPRRRVVLNLSPAAVKKQGTGLDLPMALAVMQLRSPEEMPGPECVAWGELGLDGRIRPAGRILRTLYAAWESGAERIILSPEEARLAASWVPRLSVLDELSRPAPRIFGAADLKGAWQSLQEGEGEIAASERSESSRARDDTRLLPIPRFLERALSAAALGRHHLLLIGPRGSGKSHALEWLIALAPALEERESVWNALIAELHTPECDGMPELPVRRISPQVRPAALLGAAKSGAVRPGEFSLADGGVLVADELAEWSRDSREALREPLERGKVCLTRVDGQLEFPAAFQLAATANLCGCGGIPPEFVPEDAEAHSLCRCPPHSRHAYQSRLSGPILDRVDLLLRLALQSSPREPARKTEPQAIRERVDRALVQARSRYGRPPGRLGAEEIERILRETPRFAELLSDAPLATLRSRHKVARVALSLAALDGEAVPGPVHVFEAVSYRPERLGLM
jgi:magnesium chelatase family protein